MQCSDLENFLAGAMTVDERIEFAVHLAGCPRCCAAMAEAYENAGNPLLSSLPPQPVPPRGITERITRELYLKRRQEFRAYTIQVILSACAAIVMIFSANGRPAALKNMMARAGDEPKGYAVSDSDRGSSLTDFYTEVFYDANTKK